MTRVNRTAAAVAGVGLVVAMLVTTSPGAAVSPAAAEPAEPPVAAADRTFTLITGDVVALTGEGENADAVVVEDVPPLHDVVIVRTQDGILALPGVATGLVALGRLDLRLFNLTLLAAAGYDDASRATLPLIVQAAGGRAARATTGDLPGTSGAQVALPSIQASAVTVDKDETAGFFQAVTASGAPGGASARSSGSLASGVARIWLDGPVRVMDDATNGAVGVAAAWDSGLTGEGQTIAVIDTGVDSTHPDFAGRIAESTSCVPGAGPEDDHGHGTHVASTALGSGAASDGQYAGVAPEARLVVAKALDAGGSGQESWIIECMAWAAQHADVVNMSLSGLPTDGTDPMSLALDEISAATGALFVVAAGNWGDYEVYYGFTNHETPSTPSTADRALSVGNVLIDSRPFQLDPSSSIGPRRGDHALKPQLTAPGHQVIGAHAAQNHVSSPLPGNPRYTALTGTSMAAPHVAGAAALLLQQHPDWTADQLEDALVSTTQPNADPVYHRGTGTLDVARATRQQVHATGTLDLGAPLWTERPLPLHGEVTYTNSGDGPVELGLQATYVKAPEHYIGDGEPFTPAAGAVVWGDDAVTVPAHGSVSVPVTVHLAGLPEGSVYGELVATSSDGAVRVVTGLSWTREPESYLLETRAIDHHGAPSGSHPGPPGMGGTLVVTDLDTGQTRVGGFLDGVGYLADVTLPLAEQEPRLRAGRYAVTVTLPGYEKPPYTTVYDPVSATLGSEPEIVLDEDTTLVFDAREGRPWAVDTPKPSVRQDAATMRTQRTGADGAVLVSVETAAAWTEDSIRTLASRTTAVTGGYRLDVVEHREAAPLTVTTIGRSPVTVHPTPATYLDARGREIHCDGTCAPFDVRRPVRILDLGARTAAGDLGDVRGRIVLALEDEAVPATGEFGEWLAQASLDSLIGRLHEAGAAGVLVENRDGTQMDRFARGLPEVPVWLLGHEDAERLRSATRGEEIFARITSIPVSPYVYELVTHSEGDNGDGRPVVVRQEDLGTVRTYFHDNAGAGPYLYRRFLGPFNAIGDRKGIPAGTVREEYVSPAPGHLTRGGCSGTSLCGWVVDAISAGPAADDLRFPVTVPAGAVVEQHVGGGPYRLIATGTVRAWSGRMTSDTPYYPWFAADGQVTGGAQTSGGVEFHDANIESTVLKDGVVLCDDWASTSFGDADTDACTALTGSGRYSGTVTATRPGTELSTELGVTWTANLTAPPAGAGPANRYGAPFVDPDWSLPVDAHDRLRGRAELTVRAHYTQYIRRLKESAERTVAYEGEHGAFTVRAWVSGDDGATWQQIGSTEVPRGDSARFEIPRLRGAEYLSVRVSLADEAGNGVDQYTLRAARIG